MTEVQEIAVKVLIAIATTIGVTAIYFANRKLFTPVVMFLRSLPGVVDDVKVIKSELTFNGGRSLKDYVGEMSQQLSMVEARQRGLIAALPRPTFETDCSFNWVNVNPAMERLTGLGFSSLKRKRWQSMIHEEERGHVSAEIDQAVKDKRGAMASFRFMVDGQPVWVRLDAIPVFSRLAPDTVTCWSGSLTKIDDRRVEERRTV